MRRSTSSDTEYEGEERGDLIVSALHRRSNNEQIGDFKSTVADKWEATQEWLMSPFLNDVVSQWMLAVVWALVTLISLGVVWHPEAHAHWDGDKNDC